MGRELVERAITGDHDAFVALVAAAHARLQGIARLIHRLIDGRIVEDDAITSPDLMQVFAAQLPQAG